MAGSSVHRLDTDRGPGLDTSLAGGLPDGPGSLWRRVTAYLMEGVTAILLTLVFFSGFLWLLTFAFPAGQDLRSLMASRLANPTAAISGLVHESMGNRSSSWVTAEALASLKVLRPSVRTRGVGKIAWDLARSGLDLCSGDGVQTSDAGRALLSFAEDQLELEENTLMVLGSAEVTSGTLVPRSVSVRGFTLLEGALTARVKDGGSGSVTLAMPQGVAVIEGSARSTPAEVRVSVQPDRSSVVAVVTGGATVRAGERQVALKAGQQSRIESGGQLRDPKPMPEPPSLEEPAEARAFPYLDLPPRVSFRWSESRGVEEWRLRIARDEAFRDVEVDETTRAPALEWGRLKPGTYYWRVAAVSEGLEGMPSETRRLTVQRETHPLSLTVQPLPRRVEGLSCVVQGTVDRRATVYVMGRQIEVRGDGSFVAEIQLAPGANVVLVEAVDAAGGSTYSSSVVHAKP